jgi:hypothetical protein
MAAVQGDEHARHALVAQRVQAACGRVEGMGVDAQAAQGGEHALA